MPRRTSKTKPKGQAQADATADANPPTQPQGSRKRKRATQQNQVSESAPQESTAAETVTSTALGAADTTVIDSQPESASIINADASTSIGVSTVTVAEPTLKKRSRGRTRPRPSSSAARSSSTPPDQDRDPQQTQPQQSNAGNVGDSTMPFGSPSAMTRRYFMIIASRDHLHAGISQGIVQANHGIKGPLLRMQPGDGLVLYSPRTRMAKDAEVWRKFTGIGAVGPGDVYREHVRDSWQPWRRGAEWVDIKKIVEVPIQDVLAKLDCLAYGKEKNYGMVLRRGFLEINQADWDVLWGRMVGGSDGTGDGHGEVEMEG